MTRASSRKESHKRSLSPTKILRDGRLITAHDRKLTRATHPNQLQSAAGVVAKYDAAGNLADLTVTRAGTCDKGKCAQRFAYDWDEVGQLVRARRWDYSGNTIPAGEPVYPALPTRAADRDLHYAYTMGARVLKSTTTETGAELHSLEVFDSLRVEGAQFLVDDYELNENTERVYLAGLGRLVYDGTLPSWSGDPKHVLLTIADRLGSAAFVLDKDSGELVEKITRQAYGEVESDYRPARWKSQREVYGFTGKEDDIEVGLTYFGARYFHTRLGRWASPDPLTIHTGGADPNPYAYVRGRVSTAVDPFGLDEDEVKPAPGTPEAAVLVDDDACASMTGPQCASGGTSTTIVPKAPDVATDGGTTLPEPPVPTPLPTPHNTGGKDAGGPSPGDNSPDVRIGPIARRAARDLIVANLYLRLAVAASIVPGMAGAALEGAGAALQAGEVVAEAMKITAGCFTGDTEVATREGPRPISEVTVGQEVWSFDSETQSWRWMTVTAALVHEHEGVVYALAIDGGELRATGNHPICLTSGPDLPSRPRPHDIGSDALTCAGAGRWVAVEDLRVGDEVLSAHGPTPIRRIRTFELSLPVYNLQVDRTHTYAVGATRLLVHNKPAMADAAKARALAREVPKKWQCYGKCIQFADRLQQDLKSAGVQGSRLEIRVTTRGMRVYSDSVGPLADANFGHSAVLVDGIVFDNMRPGGIPYAEFIQDLGGTSFFEAGHAQVTSTPF